MRRLGLLATGALALLVLAAGSVASSDALSPLRARAHQAASTPRFGGSWMFVETCLAPAGCAGAVYHVAFTIVQKKGSSRFTGSNDLGENVHGRQSGLSVRFTLIDPPYPTNPARYRIKLSSNGRRATGVYTWVGNHQSGKLTAKRLHK